MAISLNKVIFAQNLSTYIYSKSILKVNKAMEIVEFYQHAQIY